MIKWNFNKKNPIKDDGDENSAELFLGNIILCPSAKNSGNQVLEH